MNNVDELRNRLRALGYLNTGVDRFVLGPARDTRGVGAIALGSSLRIGLLGAVLLGPAAAVGIAARLPGLVTGARDALVLALYLGALFGGAISVVAFAAATLAGLLVRRARPGAGFARRVRRLTAGAGLLASIASLVYLTLWWQAADPAAGWNEPAWTGFALALAATISLLLGHAVRLAALAVVARSVGSLELEPRIGRPTWRATAALAAAAFAGAAVLLLATTAPPAAGDAGPAPSRFAVMPTGLRVTVIAIDGFDGSLYADLARDGRVGRLQAVLEGARARVPIRSREEPVTVWTTIATGQPAGVHGLQALETRQVAGVQGRVSGRASGLAGVMAAATDLLRLSRPAIVSGAERRAKAMWEIAAEKGLRVAVVNWWATWPARGDDAVVITDRAAVRLDRGGELAAEIAPPALYETLEPIWPDLRAEARAAAARAFAGDDEVAEVLRRSAELDAVQMRLAALPALERPDLLAVYLPGLDIAQHTLFAGDAGGRTPSELAARLDGLNRYYAFLDGLLAPMLDGRSRDDLTALVTHPGRIGEGEALFALAGGAAHAGTLEIDARLVDIAPTVAHTLGLPVSRELPGRALVELLSAPFTAKYPVREVATYGARRTEAAPGDPTVDQEVLERLRSLGYVR